MKELSQITSERLRQALEHSGISQQELANKSGVAKASISQYMHARFIPSNKSAVKMAKVLNVNPAWLMGYDVPIISLDLLSERQRLLMYEYYIRLLHEKDGENDGEN